MIEKQTETEGQIERDSFKKDFKERLKMIIDQKASGNNHQFADDIGVSNNTVTNWTKYDNSIPLANYINNICKKYKVSCDWLVLGHGDMENLSISRWDMRFQFWFKLWESNPEYCTEETLEFSKKAYWEKIKKKLSQTKKQKGKTLEKAISLITGSYDEWCELLKQALYNYGIAEDIRRKVYKFENNRLIRLSEKINNKYIPLELSPEEQNNFEMAMMHGSDALKAMVDFENEINTWLRLFEED
jgi:hypothetical protein